VSATLIACPQRLPLTATVLHPALTANPTSLDFGYVHPSAPRPLELLLTNPSRVDATWHAQLLMLPAGATQNSNSSSSAVPTAAAAAGRSSLSASGTSSGVATSSEEVHSAASSAAVKFTVQPSSGVIPGRGLGMPKAQRIVVTCAAIGNRPGAAELRLVVQHGAGCGVMLRGCGTFDEGHEHLAVLKDM
jgi:hypothetical protein